MGWNKLKHVCIRWVPYSYAVSCRSAASWRRKLAGKYEPQRWQAQSIHTLWLVNGHHGNNHEITICYHIYVHASTYIYIYICVHIPLFNVIATCLFQMPPPPSLMLPFLQPRYLGEIFVLRLQHAFNRLGCRLNRHEVQGVSPVSRGPKTEALENGDQATGSMRIMSTLVNYMFLFTKPPSLISL